MVQLHTTRYVVKNSEVRQTGLGLFSPLCSFAYRTAMQHSSGEYPFFLLYDSDPQLPTKAALCPPVVRGAVSIDDYKSHMQKALSDAWGLAQKVSRKLNRNRRCSMIRKQETLHLAQEIKSLCTCLLSDQAKLTS